MVNKILDYREEANVSTSRCNRLLVDPSSLFLSTISLSHPLGFCRVLIYMFPSTYPLFHPSRFFTEKKETEGTCLISFHLDRNNLSVSISLCSRDLLPIQQTTKSPHACVFHQDFLNASQTTLQFHGTIDPTSRKNRWPHSLLRYQKPLSTHCLLKRFFYRQTVCTILWKRTHVDWASLLCRFVANRTLLSAVSDGRSTLCPGFSRDSPLLELLSMFSGTLGIRGIR